MKKILLLAPAALLLSISPALALEDAPALSALAKMPVREVTIFKDGNALVSGGADHLVKVWNYSRGVVTHTGTGHSGNITKLTISPNQNEIYSVSNLGEIFVWKGHDM